MTKPPQSNWFGHRGEILFDDKTAPVKLVLSPWWNSFWWQNRPSQTGLVTVVKFFLMTKPPQSNWFGHRGEILLDDKTAPVKLVWSPWATVKLVWSPWWNSFWWQNRPSQTGLVTVWWNSFWWQNRPSQTGLVTVVKFFLMTKPPQSNWLGHRGEILFDDKTAPVKLVWSPWWNSFWWQNRPSQTGLVTVVKFFLMTKPPQSNWFGHRGEILLDDKTAPVKLVWSPWAPVKPQSNWFGHRVVKLFLMTKPPQSNWFGHRGEILFDDKTAPVKLVWSPWWNSFWWQNRPSQTGLAPWWNSFWWQNRRSQTGLVTVVKFFLMTKPPQSNWFGHRGEILFDDKTAPVKLVWSPWWNSFWLQNRPSQTGLVTVVKFFLMTKPPSQTGLVPVVKFFLMTKPAQSNWFGHRGEILFDDKTAPVKLVWSPWWNSSWGQNRPSQTGLVTVVKFFLMTKPPQSNWFGHRVVKFFLMTKPPRSNWFGHHDKTAPVKLVWSPWWNSFWWQNRQSNWFGHRGEILFHDKTAPVKLVWSPWWNSFWWQNRPSQTGLVTVVKFFLMTKPPQSNWFGHRGEILFDDKTAPVKLVWSPWWNSFWWQNRPSQTGLVTVVKFFLMTKPPQSNWFGHRGEILFDDKTAPVKLVWSPWWNSSSWQNRPSQTGLVTVVKFFLMTKPPQSNWFGHRGEIPFDDKTAPVKLVWSPWWNSFWWQNRPSQTGLVTVVKFFLMTKPPQSNWFGHHDKTAPVKLVWSPWWNSFWWQNRPSQTGLVTVVKFFLMTKPPQSNWFGHRGEIPFDDKTAAAKMVLSPWWHSFWWQNRPSQTGLVTVVKFFLMTKRPQSNWFGHRGEILFDDKTAPVKLVWSPCFFLFGDKTAPVKLVWSPWWNSFWWQNRPSQTGLAPGWYSFWWQNRPSQTGLVTVVKFFLMTKPPQSNWFGHRGEILFDDKTAPVKLVWSPWWIFLMTKPPQSNWFGHRGEILFDDKTAPVKLVWSPWWNSFWWQNRPSQTGLVTVVKFFLMTKPPQSNWFGHRGEILLEDKTAPVKLVWSPWWNSFWWQNRPSQTGLVTVVKFFLMTKPPQSNWFGHHDKTAPVKLVWSPWWNSFWWQNRPSQTGLVTVVKFFFMTKPPQSNWFGHCGEILFGDKTAPPKLVWSPWWNSFWWQNRPSQTGLVTVVKFFLMTKPPQSNWFGHRGEILFDDKTAPVKLVWWWNSFWWQKPPQSNWFGHRGEILFDDKAAPVKLVWSPWWNSFWWPKPPQSNWFGHRGEILFDDKTAPVKLVWWPWWNSFWWQNRPSQTGLVTVVQFFFDDKTAPVKLVWSPWWNSFWWQNRPSQTGLVTVVKFFLMTKPPQSNWFGHRSEIPFDDKTAPVKLVWSPWWIFLMTKPPQSNWFGHRGEILFDDKTAPVKLVWSQWWNSFWWQNRPSQTGLVTVVTFFLMTKPPQSNWFGHRGEILFDDKTAPVKLVWSPWWNSFWWQNRPSQTGLVTVFFSFWWQNRPSQTGLVTVVKFFLMTKPPQSNWFGHRGEILFDDKTAPVKLVWSPWWNGEILFDDKTAPVKLVWSPWWKSFWWQNRPSQTGLVTVVKFFLMTKLPQSNWFGHRGEILLDDKTAPVKLVWSPWWNSFWWQNRPSQTGLVTVVKFFLMTKPPQSNWFGHRGEILFDNKTGPAKLVWSPWWNSFWWQNRPSQTGLVTVVKFFLKTKPPQSNWFGHRGEILFDGKTAPVKLVWSPWWNSFWWQNRPSQTGLVTVVTFFLMTKPPQSNWFGHRGEILFDDKTAPVKLVWSPWWNSFWWQNRPGQTGLVTVVKFFLMTKPPQSNWFGHRGEFLFDDKTAPVKLVWSPWWIFFDDKTAPVKLVWFLMTKPPQSNWFGHRGEILFDDKTAPVKLVWSPWWNLFDDKTAPVKLVWSPWWNSFWWQNRPSQTGLATVVKFFLMTKPPQSNWFGHRGEILFMTKPPQSNWFGHRGAILFDDKTAPVKLVWSPWWNSFWWQNRPSQTGLVTVVEFFLVTKPPQSNWFGHRGEILFDDLNRPSQTGLVTVVKFFLMTKPPQSNWFGHRGEILFDDKAAPVKLVWSPWWNSFWWQNRPSQTGLVTVVKFFLMTKPPQSNWFGHRGEILFDDKTAPVKLVWSPWWNSFWWQNRPSQTGLVTVVKFFLMTKPPQTNWFGHRGEILFDDKAAPVKLVWSPWWNSFWWQNRPSQTGLVTVVKFFLMTKPPQSNWFGHRGEILFDDKTAPVKLVGSPWWNSFWWQNRPSQTGLVTVVKFFLMTKPPQSNWFGHRGDILFDDKTAPVKLVWSPWRNSFWWQNRLSQTGLVTVVKFFLMTKPPQSNWFGHRGEILFDDKTAPVKLVWSPWWNSFWWQNRPSQTGLVTVVKFFLMTKPPQSNWFGHRGEILFDDKTAPVKLVWSPWWNSFWWQNRPSQTGLVTVVKFFLMTKPPQSNWFGHRGEILFDDKTAPVKLVWSPWWNSFWWQSRPSQTGLVTVVKFFLMTKPPQSNWFGHRGEILFGDKTAPVKLVWWPWWNSFWWQNRPSPWWNSFWWQNRPSQTGLVTVVKFFLMTKPPQSNWFGHRGEILFDDKTAPVKLVWSPWWNSFWWQNRPSQTGLVTVVKFFLMTKPPQSNWFGHRGEILFDDKTAPVKLVWSPWWNSFWWQNRPSQTGLVTVVKFFLVTKPPQSNWFGHRGEILFDDKTAPVKLVWSPWWHSFWWQNRPSQTGLVTVVKFFLMTKPPQSNWFGHRGEILFGDKTAPVKLVWSPWWNSFWWQNRPSQTGLVTVVKFFLMTKPPQSNWFGHRGEILFGDKTAPVKLVWSPWWNSFWWQNRPSQTGLVTVVKFFLVTKPPQSNWFGHRGEILFDDKTAPVKLVWYVWWTSRASNPSLVWPRKTCRISQRDTWTHCSETLSRCPHTEERTCIHSSVFSHCSSEPDLLEHTNLQNCIPKTLPFGNNQLTSWWFYHPIATYYAPQNGSIIPAGRGEKKQSGQISIPKTELRVSWRNSLTFYHHLKVTVPGGKGRDDICPEQ